MIRRRNVVSLVLIGLLSACASFKPALPEYDGPTATIQDRGFAEDGTKAQLFAVVEIDGKQIMNAFWASAKASDGYGHRLITMYPIRKVKVVPMKLTLKGSHITGMPLHALASQLAGTFFSVEGQVDFTPEPDGRYSVRGELTKTKSSIWIEDEATGKPVTRVITN